MHSSAEAKPAGRRGARTIVWTLFLWSIHRIYFTFRPSFPLVPSQFSHPIPSHGAFPLSPPFDSLAVSLMCASCVGVYACQKRQIKPNFVKLIAEPRAPGKIPVRSGAKWDIRPIAWVVLGVQLASRSQNSSDVAFAAVSARLPLAISLLLSPLIYPFFLFVSPSPSYLFCGALFPTPFWFFPFTDPVGAV